MPRLSALGDAIMGIADTPSINGSPVGVMAGMPTSGRWDWYSNVLAFGPLAPNFASTAFQLYTYDTGSTALTLIDNYGANGTYVIAGGNSWAAWVSDGRGVKTSIGGLGPFPAGYILAASRTGDLALETAFVADQGVKIYSSAGTLIDQLNVTLAYNDRLTLRQNVFAYAITGQGWLLRDYVTRATLSFLRRGDGIDQCIPFVDGSDVWVLERNNVERLTVRKKDDTTAWDVAPPSANAYLYPDAISLSAGVARLAWCNTIGEAAASLTVMDLTLATGANTVATVVAGALVFVPQAPLGTIAVTGTVIPAGSPGGSPGGSGGTNPSPGRAVIASRVAPPKAAEPSRKYPHVDQIPEFPTRQSLRLAWDQVSSHSETLDTHTATIAAQAKQIETLQKQVELLLQHSNVAYKGTT